METTVRLLRKKIRHRPRNKHCAITRIALSECDLVFSKITEHGFVRGYEAKNLYNYFKSILLDHHLDIESLKWPVSRENVASVEVKRLEKALEIPNHRRASTIKNEHWAGVFLETLLSSIEQIKKDIADSIMGEGDLTEISEVAELTSNLSASMLYVSLLSKTKFRRVKNQFRHEHASVNHIFQEIKTLAEEMADLFSEHDIVLSWMGRNIIPIIRRLEVPSNLR